MPEDWDCNRRNAGFARNEEMLDEHDAHVVLAWTNVSRRSDTCGRRRTTGELAVEVVFDDGGKTWMETVDGKLRTSRA